MCMPRTGQGQALSAQATSQGSPGAEINLGDGIS